MKIILKEKKNDIRDGIEKIDANDLNMFYIVKWLI